MLSRRQDVPVTRVTAAGRVSNYESSINPAPSAKPRSQKMFRSTILMTAAVVGLAFGGAHAATSPQITLKISDFNLNSPKDVQRLYDRIAEGASEVCGRGPLTVFFPAPPPEFVACRDAAIDATLSQIPVPQVQALRKSKPSQMFAAAPASETQH